MQCQVNRRLNSSSHPFGRCSFVHTEMLKNVCFNAMIWFLHKYSHVIFAGIHSSFSLANYCIPSRLKIKKFKFYPIGIQAGLLSFLVTSFLAIFSEFSVDNFFLYFASLLLERLSGEVLIFCSSAPSR